MAHTHGSPSPFLDDPVERTLLSSEPEAGGGWWQPDWVKAARSPLKMTLADQSQGSPSPWEALDTKPALGGPQGHGWTSHLSGTFFTRV